MGVGRGGDGTPPYGGENKRDRTISILDSFFYIIGSKLISKIRKIRSLLISNFNSMKFNRKHHIYETFFSHDNITKMNYLEYFLFNSSKISILDKKSFSIRKKKKFEQKWLWKKKRFFQPSPLRYPTPPYGGGGVGKGEIKINRKSLDNYLPKSFLEIFLNKREKFSNKNFLFKNSLYTVSYFSSWKFSKDWKSFIYYSLESFYTRDKYIGYYSSLNLGRFSTRSVSTKQLGTLTGASFIQKLLKEFARIELQKIIKQHQIFIPILNRSIRKWKKLSQKKTYFSKIQKLFQKRDCIMKRFKLLSLLYNQNTNPNSMILSILPVLPPDLRPILKLQNQIAASDLNRLYQRIIYRNERFKKFLKNPSTSQSFEIKYAQRLLQESVDNLIDNGKGGVRPETNSRGQPLKSLSEILKGKQGRFRQYLLGKRVDYSGRSVIVVGPKLKLSECGLPVKMAIELFLPFLMKKIFHYKLAKTVVGAKNLIYSNQKLTWNLLSQIMKNHPILLNRAPTLHRLGIQAFLPKLIQGQAILLHPLVCPAFNADFDGDQMAVHVPITVEARTEAWSFLFSRNHLLSSATGEPIILPSQDMVLGCYYLTSENLSLRPRLLPPRRGGRSRGMKQLYLSKLKLFMKQKNFYLIEFLKNSILDRKVESDNIEFSKILFNRICFYDWDSVLTAYYTNQISLQSIIWLKWTGKTQLPNESFSPVEIRINLFGQFQKIQSKFSFYLDPKGNISNQYIRTTAGKVLMNNIIKNCRNFH